jgi:ABC-2 type transport system ATP-binding protein
MADSAAEPLLELKGITYRYPVRDGMRFWRRKKGAGVHQVNMRLEAGDIVGLIGPNGAGKTTLLHTIAGLWKPDSGSFRVLGRDAQEAGRRWVQRHIGFMPEQVVWTGSSTPRLVLERLITMRGGDDDAIKMLRLVGLRTRADSPLDSLSQGMEQRMTLATALLGEPTILLLDEPMNGLDPVAQAAFRGLLQQLSDRGCGIIVSSHNLNEMERVVDRVAIMNHGQLVASGPMAEVERMLALEQRLLLAGSGPKPDLTLLTSEGVIIEEKETRSVEEDWRYRLIRQAGRWEPGDCGLLTAAVEEAGGVVQLIHPLPAALEDLLGAVTGQDPAKVGLELEGDELIPLRTLEVDEDE